MEWVSRIAAIIILTILGGLGVAYLSYPEEFHQSHQPTVTHGPISDEELKEFERLQQDVIDLRRQQLELYELLRLYKEGKLHSA